MTKLASRTLMAALALAVFTAGCDDEDLPAPDAGSAPRDGGADGAAAGDGSVADAAAGDAAAGEAGAPALPYTTPLSIEEERGRYLVENVIGCPDCHTPRTPMGALITAQYMSGVECFVKLPNNDCIHSRNLTSHSSGLGNRTKDEIKRMFTEGVRPSSTGDVALHPIMPYYIFRNMDPADADAIVAFLQKIKPIDKTLPMRGASFNVPAPSPATNPDAIPMPMASYPNREAAMRGRYLATKTGLCLECHTPHNMGPGEVLMSAKFFQGGEMFPILPGVSPTSKNLTSDMMTGLGSWTVQDIVRALKEGKDKEGKGICPPMPVGPNGPYGGLTNQDATDIAHYIKSLAPAVNMVADMCTWPPMMPPAGDGGAPAGDGGAAADGASSGDAPAGADATAADGSAGSPG